MNNGIEISLHTLGQKIDDLKKELNETRNQLHDYKCDNIKLRRRLAEINELGGRVLTFKSELIQYPEQSQAKDGSV